MLLFMGDCRQKLFYRTGNFISCTIKKLRDDAHSRVEKMSAELTTLGAQKQSSPS